VAWLTTSSLYGSSRRSGSAFHAITCCATKGASGTTAGGVGCGRGVAGGRREVAADVVGIAAGVGESVSKGPGVDAVVKGVSGITVPEEEISGAVVGEGVISREGVGEDVWDITRHVAEIVVESGE
jgi:hypothetical protein